jgi:hypothetical protein
MRKNQRKPRRVRNAKRRDRAGTTIKTLSAGTPRAGAPVGRFGRPVRRMENAVAHGEYLEREIARADNPGDQQAAQLALLRQIAKVERLNYVLNR